MGQYYKPAILSSNKRKVEKWIYARNYDNFLKLMEHSYLHNNFVRIFETFILNNPQRVVWAGDYAKPNKSNGIRKNIFNRCTDENEFKESPKPLTIRQSRYIINHSKLQFVDKTKLPKKDGLKLHPLPLLTCEGNGQGGGDYFGPDENNLVGSWARDIISVSSQSPTKDYVELNFDLVKT